ncbi:flagellar biosynthesis protein FlhA [Garciella nitratireducens]|uniref:Flagellar biosynthesis protein FlhA n=1 Tax=Garciella nitratireducens DSM 15102 TaxID=1121911 RepID=A0A1T4LDA5_9FIRM|nr:flagellar biosynthesis protein FlhA [Garciella nitratireducens]RBP46749.1 flagellar biosynthesis protein FlhA [Garciella nitratireducens]SJZ52504.1 flagellar biosynthesis protein FlhA [Garciella nitratireducens DSM 15102]
MENQNNLLGKVRKNTDIIVAFGVMGIITLIILPISTVLLDILLTFNITLSVIILLLSMFTTDILQFSIFPTLLLITTLFRLGLNISSTRLILSQGNAGQVVEAFGNFVTGDNYIVGGVIFVIIIVIQLIVITSGASRVSEVSARFTLDAMPGKQMSIDADLNAGAINDQEAKLRRKKLQQEADFYGAMDGAMKFVKGDSIAGMIITVINFIGGIAIHVLQNDLAVIEALSKFALLTIGDGLVSQIPSLLISVSSGILVTRSSSDESFGTDLGNQLFSFPKVLIITSIVLFILGIVPGLPTVPFLVLAIVSGIVAYLLKEEEKQNHELIEIAATEDMQSKPKEPEDIRHYVQVEPLEIEIGYGLISLADEKNGGDLLERITGIRRQCALEMGIVVPPIRIRDNLQLQTNEYILKIKGIEVARGQVMPNHLLVMDPENKKIDLPGIATTEPAFGLPALWIEESLRDKAEMMGATIVDATTVMVTHLSEVIKEHGYELIGRQQVKELLDVVKEKYSAVVQELIPDLLSLGEVQKVLQNLLRERVPINDLVTILETLADYAPNTKDIELLTEYVRTALSRNIVLPYLDENKVIHVITIHPKLEQYLSDNIQRSFQGSFPAIEPSVNTKILENIHEQIDRLSMQQINPVILTSPKIRAAFKRMIELAFPGIAVLSLNEIPNSIEIKVEGMVKVDED